MNEPEPVNDRLDAVETNWSLIREAARETTLHATPARAALVVRYLPAITRYVTAIVRDESTGQDLTQDICARLMNGDFSGADKSRGRFRDYLKTAVRNIARTHWRREKLRTVQELPESLTQESLDEEAWVAAWRSAVLDMAWRAIQTWERKTTGAIGYTLLKLRADHPEDSLADLTTRLNSVTHGDYAINALRTQLHRARTRFAELLLREIARTLTDPSPEQLQEELAVLGLLEYVAATGPGD